MSRIINSIIVDDEPVAREILQGHLSKIESINVLASCKNAVEAFEAINSHPIDLVFLDINMPEISGLSFARAMTQNIKIIFTTAYREYAVDGFDLQAVDYLLKPISFERLFKAINKFMGETNPVHNHDPLNSIEKNDSIFVRSDRKMIKIKFSEIRYIESLSDYIKIYLSDKTIVTRETISNIEAKLPKDDFLRVHRSFLVSFASIESFTKEIIEITGKEIPISRSYRSEVLQRLESPSP
jgi:DNA-binding LytR/AlgR family response regulator